MSALAEAVPALFEDGVVRFDAPPPSSEGASVTVSVRPSALPQVPPEVPQRDQAVPETRADPAPALDSDDSLVKLLRLTGDGPGDGSLLVDDYEFGRNRPNPDGRDR